MVVELVTSLRGDAVDGCFVVAEAAAIIEVELSRGPGAPIERIEGPTSLVEAVRRFVRKSRGIMSLDSG